MEVDNDRLKSCDTGLQNRGAPDFKNHVGNASIPVAVTLPYGNNAKLQNKFEFVTSSSSPNKSSDSFMNSKCVTTAHCSVLFSTKT